MVRTQLEKLEEFSRIYLEREWKFNKTDVKILNDGIAIGQGTNGVVFHVLHLSTNTHMAMKQIPMRSSKIIYLDEAVMLSQLRHKNLVEFLGAREEGNAFFILMTYCGNGNLVQYCTKHTPKERLNILIQLAEGICYLHSKDIVHRDLKPDVS